MCERFIVVCLSMFFILTGTVAYAEDETSKRVTSEKIIAQIKLDSFQQGSLKISPDLNHIAYIAKEGDNSFAVMDGERKLYHNVLYIKFSPDSKRVAYVVSKNGKMFLVVDDKEQKKYEEVTFPINFSPDSKRLCYNIQEGNKMFVVVDGEEKKKYDGIMQHYPIFSPDNKKVVYSASEGNEKFVVLDGREGKSYESIVADSISFSPDSSRVVYGAIQKSKYFAVIDGEEQEKYDDLGTPIFSPDSKRVTYWARRGESYFSIINNEKHPNSFGPTFSSDSKRVAFIGFDSGGQYIVVDGKNGKKYHVVKNPVFSPDSKRVAYAATLGDKWLKEYKFFVVVDGIEDKKYTSVDIGTITFSSDSKYIAYVAIRDKRVDAPTAKFTIEGGEKCVVFGGKCGQSYDEIISVDGKAINFNAENEISYVAMRQDQIQYPTEATIYLVKERIEQ